MAYQLYKLDFNKIVIYELFLSFCHSYKCELIWSVCQDSVL